MSDLARHAGAGAPQPARPAWYTCLALEPGARSASAELLTALTVQWLTVAVTRSTATAPAVIIAGADEITRGHLEALADACERRGVPLTLLFRHLRDDATALIGGASATAFMRLGNHHEAEQAASFIGRHHKFTVSGWTATQGGEHSTASTSGYSHGTSQSPRHQPPPGMERRRAVGPDSLRRAHPLPRPRAQPGMVTVRHRLRRERAGAARRAPSGSTSTPSSPPSCRTCPATPCCSRHAAPPAPACWPSSATRRSSPCPAPPPAWPRPAIPPSRARRPSRRWPELAPPRHQPAQPAVARPPAGARPRGPRSGPHRAGPGRAADPARPAASARGRMRSLPASGHGGASCASTLRIRPARSAAVAACTQTIGRSGPGARADAGRTAVHWRPPCGSHTAHAGNSRYKAMTWLTASWPRCQARPAPPAAAARSRARHPARQERYRIPRHLFPSSMPEGADIAAQSLARAALTRRSISGSAGTRCLVATRAGCGLSGSARPGALTGTGAGSQAASGWHAALPRDAGLVMAGDAPSQGRSGPCG